VCTLELSKQQNKQNYRKSTTEEKTKMRKPELRRVVVADFHRQSIVVVQAHAAVVGVVLETIVGTVEPEAALEGKQAAVVGNVVAVAVVAVDATSIQ